MKCLIEDTNEAKTEKIERECVRKVFCKYSTNKPNENRERLREIERESISIVEYSVM